MSYKFVVRPEDVIEQILIQSWVFRARGGDYGGARRAAEETLERLLSDGLPHRQSTAGLWLDPYAANNLIKARPGTLNDPAWPAWQETAHRNATSLPAAPHMYRFTMRREWHSYTVSPTRPVVLRLPLPLRGAQHGAARVKVLNHSLVDMRETPGRVEIRVTPRAVREPIVAELEVDFVNGESRDSLAAAAPIGASIGPDEQIWLRDREGLVVQSPSVVDLAKALAAEAHDARAFVHRAWNWLISQLRFGDVHRTDLDSADPLGGLMQTKLADCMLGSSLLIALCRAQEIPARLVSGYLLHPANLGPHSWAEVRVAPGEWIAVDFGSWCYCAGDVTDPEFGRYFLGRTDARFLAEIAPREFTGWGSAPPPEDWYRLERLEDQKIVHTLHALPGNTLFRRDTLDLQILAPA